MNWQSGPPGSTNDQKKPEERPRHDVGAAGGEVSCPQCSFKSHRNMMIAHIREIHEQRKSFESCPQCDYKAPMKHHIKQHIEANHMKPKDFYCQRCSFKTMLKTSLRHHYKTEHKDINIHALMGE